MAASWSAAGSGTSWWTCMGLLLGVAVTAASADDGNAAPEVLWQLDDAAKFPRLRVV